MRKPPPAESSFWKVFHGFTRLHVCVYRATRGRLGGRIDTLPVLLLHHTGRRTGTERISPVNYLADDPNLLVVASKGGVDTHPAWFHNLMAMSSTTVELPGGRTRTVRPRVVEGEERAALWSRLSDAFRPYREYATFTDREIPVVVLEPL